MSMLEDKIRKNSGSFDVREPAEGHFERFNQRLNDLHGKENKAPLMGVRITKIAATALVLAALSGLLIFLLQGERNQALAAGLPDELKEAKRYYELQAKETMEQLSACSISADQEDQLLDYARDELGKIDRQARELEDEYKLNPGNERVEKALIDNFQSKNIILKKMVERICKL